MIDLLSPHGLSALRKFITPKTVFAFDLDGTLAPIIDKPSAVKVPEEICNTMQSLSNIAVTAVITGRSRIDAEKRLCFKPHFLIGNHGSEGLPGVIKQDFLTTVKNWEKQLKSLLKPEYSAKLFFEQKGNSLSIHYRNTDNPTKIHNAILEAISFLNPEPHRIGGKFVENLIPEGLPNKGDALLRIIEYSGCNQAFFLGDDETDEDVFKLQNPGILSGCIGLDRKTAAKYFLRSQAKTAELLNNMLNSLKLIPYTERTNFK